MLDISGLLTSVAADAMGLRRKRHRRAGGFLGNSRGSFLNTSTLVGLAGLAVGAYQIFKDKSASPSAPVGRVTPGTTVLGDSGRPMDDFAAPRATPPLPAVATSTARKVDDMPLRAIRVMIAAARCDGGLGEEEMGRLISHARDAGLESAMRAEWQSPRPLAEICAGIEDLDQKRDLYVLAYAVLRADEQVSGSERVFLAQLAARLGLSPEASAALETQTAARIDSVS